MHRYLIQIAIIILVSYANTQGQTSELKYKDIHPTLQDMPNNEAFDILQKFQKQDPYHANAYYQLGIAAYNLAKTFDPLTDYNNLSYFTYHANLYYGLAHKYLDEKEAKKNKDFYHDVIPAEGEKKVTYTQILNSLNKKISEVKEFDKNISHIRKNYFGAVSNYSNSLSGFKAIVDKNSQLKNIYLTADSILIANIESIGIHFDSTLYYFDAYEKAISKYPIKNYNQTYTIDTINTYKLDGLTKSNFLENEFVLWNYKVWSDSVLSIINNNISQLRFDIKSEGEIIKSLYNVVELTKDYSGDFDYYSINDKLSYRVGRYDFQPLILNIFNYQISKLNLLICSKKPINNPSQTKNTSINLHKKLLFYSELIDKKQITSKELASLKQNATQFNNLKYKNYITNYFNSSEGLTKYINSEPEIINNTLDKSLINLKKTIIIEKNKKYQFTDIIQFDKGSISLASIKKPLSGKKTNYYYTTSIDIDSDGNKYISGYYNAEKKNTTAFIAKCDSLLDLKWIKKYDLSTNKKNRINNYASHIALTSNGCISIIHTRDTIDGTVNIKNWVVSLSNTGKELSKNVTGPNLVPKHFIFDDINEKITVAYKGTKFINNEKGTDAMIIEFADSIGGKIWETPLFFNGELVNIIKSNNNLIVVANFTNLNYKEKEISLDENITNSFVCIINNKGTINDIKTYPMPNSYYLTHAVKLDSENINILGVKTTETDLYKVQNDPKIKLFYILLDTKGNIEYKY